MKNLILILFAAASFQPAFAEENIHLISVNGLAEKAIDPNMTILQVEVWGKGQTAKAAQDMQAKLYEKVKDAVEKFKIKKEDVQTDSFSISPESVYDDKTRSNHIVGYRVSHILSLIYRKVEGAGTLIDALAASVKGDSGGVNIQNIAWDYDKKSVIESSVLAEAVKAARAKAEELAKASGVKIKAVHRVQQISSTPSVTGRIRPMMMMDKGMDAASTEVSSGQIKIYVNVQMDFEI